MAKRYSLIGTALGLLAVLAACVDSGTGPIDAPNFNVQVSKGSLLLCKWGPEGTSGTFTISQDGPGSLPLGTTVTIPALPHTSDCVELNTRTVWLADPEASGNTLVTITESDDATVDRIYWWVTGDTYHTLNGVNTVTIEVGPNIAGKVIFKNSGGTPRGEGCTPGYWKQPQHFDSWPAPYTPGTLFNDVFGAGFDGLTLLEVMQLKGGDLNALGRHTVAALLNAASSVDYDLSVADVIAAFQAAYAGGDYEGTKDVFEGYNELGCPLN